MQCPSALPKHCLPSRVFILALKLGKRLKLFFRWYTAFSSFPLKYPISIYILLQACLTGLDFFFFCCKCECVSRWCTYFRWSILLKKFVYFLSNKFSLLFFFSYIVVTQTSRLWFSSVSYSSNFECELQSQNFES